jgi:hypothetical protein
VLDDAFGQLKEVSAAFAQHMRDASKRSCGVQASEEPAAADEGSAALEAEQLVQQQEEDATAAATAGYSASAGYSQDAFEAEEQQQQQSGAAASAGWSAVLPEDEPHPVLHFQALLQAEQAAAAGIAATTAAAAAVEAHAASEVADVSDSMQLGAAGSSSAQQPGSEGIADISEAFEVGVIEASHSAAALISAVSSEMLPNHTASAAALHSSRSSIAEALTCTELPTAQDSAASTVGEELGVCSHLEALAAAPEVVSGSQHYGSSSFESYGDSRTMQQQQQQDRHLLEQQVSLNWWFANVCSHWLVGQLYDNSFSRQDLYYASFLHCNKLAWHMFDNLFLPRFDPRLWYNCTAAVAPAAG